MVEGLGFLAGAPGGGFKNSGCDTLEGLGSRPSVRKQLLFEARWA